MKSVENWKNATRELLEQELYTLRTERPNTYELPERAAEFRDFVQHLCDKVEGIAITTFYNFNVW